jgi:hypothetical protein
MAHDLTKYKINDNYRFIMYDIQVPCPKYSCSGGNKYYCKFFAIKDYGSDFPKPNFTMDDNCSISKLLCLLR